MESSETDRGRAGGSDKRAEFGSTARDQERGASGRGRRELEVGAEFQSGFIFVMSVVSWVARKFSILHSQICQPLPGF